MNDKHALRGFLIKRFLILLALTGIAQFFLNLFYHNWIYPWLSEVFALEQLLADADLSETMLQLLEGIVWGVAGSVFDLLPGGIGTSLRTAFLSRTEDQLTGQLLDHLTETIRSMTPLQARLHVTGMFCSFLALLLLWLLPYILASVSFAVTVSKKAAALELAAKEQQLSYERQRNLLLSDVAHDLKTPLTTVAGYALALSEGQIEDPTDQRIYLNAIYHKSMQMSELVDLLFEYVKLDSAGFTLKKENVNLCELLREHVADLYTDFEQKGMPLDVAIPDTRICVSLDALQFGRAIRNLLINILKHNPEGTNAGIELVEQGASLRITVWDTGTVIPEETALHLFEPFVQGDASRSSKGGSGLGLSITAKIVAMHGGTIVLNQEAAEMRTKSFVITLPKPPSDY